MNVDSIKQYVALRAALKQEKAQLESRLAAINHALSETSAPVNAVVAAPAGAKASPPAPRRRGRAANKLSLKEAVVQVLSAGPLDKKEILSGVSKLGYKFKASDPMNSLNTLLYTPGNFKNLGGGQWGSPKK